MARVAAACEDPAHRSGTSRRCSGRRRLQRLDPIAECPVRSIAGRQCPRRPLSAANPTRRPTATQAGHPRSALTSTACGPGRGTSPGRPGTRACSPCRRTSRWCPSCSTMRSDWSVSTSMPQTGSIAMAMAAPPAYSRVGGPAGGAYGQGAAAVDAGVRIRRWRPADVPRPRARRCSPSATRLAGRASARRSSRPGDDLRLAGRRGQPGLRAAARPRPARPHQQHTRAGRGGARAARRRVRSGPASAAAKPIAAARLEAMPWAANCIDCQRDRRSRTPADGRRAALVGLEDVRAAAAVLRGVATRTPLVPFGPPARPPLPQGREPPADRRLQDPRRVRRGRVAAGRRAGARRHHLLVGQPRPGRGTGRPPARRPAVVVMPSDAPAIKRERVEADGAEIIVVGTASDERQAVAERIAAERALTIIPPFDDDRIIAGQGTVGLEIARGPPGRGCRARPDRRRRARERRRHGGQGASGRPPGWSASSRSWRPTRATRSRAARSSNGRPRTSRGRSPTARGRRPSAPGPSRTCAASSTRSSRSARRRSPPGVRLAAERARLVVEPSGRPVGRGPRVPGRGGRRGGA